LEIDKIKAVIKAKTEEFEPLFRRMDGDYTKRWLGKRTVFPKKRINDIEFISNAPRTFCNNVQSILTSAERQIVVTMAEVEGKDKRKDIGKLERLFDFGFERADERLTNLLLPSLQDSSVWHSIVRGRIAARILSTDGEDALFDYSSLDPRWLVYQVGANGFLWTSYTFLKTPEELEDEFGKRVKDKPWYKVWEKPKTTYEVIDYWRREGEGKVSNAVICNDVWLKEPEAYNMQSLPIVVSIVPTSPPVRSVLESGIEDYGESIFAPNRDIDDLQDKMGSTWATHAQVLAVQPLFNYMSVGGDTYDETLIQAGGIANIPKDTNEIVASPLKEISPTLVNLYSVLENRRVSGAMPEIQISNPPQSGTLQALILESSNRVLTPHLRNMENFYAQVCRLVEEQLLSTNLKVNIKAEYEKKYYAVKVTPVDLKRPHITKVKFTARTPWTQLDVAQQAEMLVRLGLPKGWVWENILKIQDATLLNDLLALEIYENSPQGMMKRAVEVLVDKKYYFEARKLAEEMDRMETANAGDNQPTPVSEREVPPPVGAV